MNTYNLSSMQLPEWSLPLILILVLWTLFWKGLALWHAAHQNNRPWFIILLIFNTLGILEIFFLFYVAKIKTNKLFK